MPNEITINGITVETRAEIVAALIAELQAIYGPGINVDPNSPDGQMIGIYAQAAEDLLQEVVQTYNSFDPDTAIGISLDRDCAYNGVIRQVGSYTQQVVTVNTTQSVTLVGIDTSPLTAFTVADGAGNRFVLKTTTSVGSGANNLDFQAAQLGAIVTTPNTITTIVTVQLGVSTVNNAAANTSTGTNEETDYSLRIRRANSVALPSQGFLNGLYGGLLDVDGVTAAIVLENYTNSTDADGIPAHYIWVIVQGGTNADVADVIYRKRNAGAGMKGSTSSVIHQLDGTDFTVHFDRPTSENLWISFDVNSLTSAPVNDAYLRAQLLALLTYNVSQPADTTTIVALVRQIYPNAYVNNEGVSTDGVYYTDIVFPTAKNYQFSTSAARIIINGLPG